jgi:hypothetical protein
VRVTVQALTGGEWRTEDEFSTLRAAKVCARTAIEWDGAARRIVAAGVVVFTVGVVGMVGQAVTL